MAVPWQTLATVDTDEGALVLRQRGADFLIVIGGRVLMTSTARRSEEALSTVAATALCGRAGLRVLIGGLGMAYTLRAALDAFPPDTRIAVAELTPAVVAWCRGPLAPLTHGAASDPRVEILIGDVAQIIGRARGSYDAILLDLYEGPNAQTQGRDDPFYGPGALARSHAALRPGGLLAVWSEEADAGFARRFGGAGFDVTTHRSGKGGRTHVVYVGLRTDRR